MAEVIDPKEFGVSFSVKQCRNFGLDPQETLDWLLQQGFRRFRLMSYWNEHEKESGLYDFIDLDWQIKRVQDAGGIITLCLGARQPRWPENHWPAWAWQADRDVRTTALLRYVQEVVKRYDKEPSITSYQLENEALLKRWGDKPEVDRARLRAEFTLVKSLSTKPIIMTTSTSWGIPIRKPQPDVVGFSYYNVIYRDGDYHTSLFYPWVHRLRKWQVITLRNRPVFIHELQLEPWGPTAIWKMSIEEQDKSMNSEQITSNIKAARQIHAYPVDLWGGEWWYWRFRQGDKHIWHTVKAALTHDQQ